MGNLKKWGGPMPQSFLEQQHALQLHILPRLQSLGIIGVLPAFAGFVPDALRYAFPNASITRGAQWMTGTSAVDPSVTVSHRTQAEQNPTHSLIDLTNRLQIGCTGADVMLTECCV
jgi:hypothetical protein